MLAWRITFLFIYFLPLDTIHNYSLWSGRRLVHLRFSLSQACENHLGVFGLGQLFC